MTASAVATQLVPDPFLAGRRHIGPYRLIAMVGQGATGVVFRAVHTLSGDEVAVKTLRAVDPDDVACLRREIQALRRLRDPGVVQIREQGIDAGIPWYAMELIEGTTIDSLWRSRVGVQVKPPADLATLQPTLRVLARLCQTLAFLHGEGIVHRDLKPANVILRHGDSPVLVDFAFVTNFGAAVSREVLDIGGGMLGSIPYMAPEQARGEFVDARADLYSIGCILYEAVCGRPPFVGTAAEVLYQQLDAAPEPPSKHARGLPAELEQLICHLLAKNPRQRMGYAVDVAARLRSLAADGGGDAADCRPSRMYLYRPEFAGRTQALEYLAGRVRQLRQGSGGLVLIGGESGVGKTRLAMEVTRCVASDTVVVVAGQCVSLAEGGADNSDAQGGPLHPLVPLLRYIADYCLARGREASDRVVGRRGKVLAAYVPLLATLPGQEQYLEPMPLQAQAARERMVGDLAETLSLFAKEAPLILVLDDLQWADELTLHTLSSLPAEFYEQAPMLVVGCYRNDEAGPALRALARSAKCARLDLDRLDVSTVGSIVCDMLALRSVPQPLIRFLAEQSEGNPFFVSEYLRTVVGEQLLVRSTASEWRVAGSDAAIDQAYDGLPLPGTVRELVARRLDAVDGAARLIIETAAVLGREFEASLAAAVADLDENRQMEAITQLLARQIFEEVKGERLRFVHDKLREVAYARLPAPRSQELHRRAAVAIEDHYRRSDRFSAWYGALAVHWSSAGEDRPAAGYFGRAAETALRSGAAGEARSLLARALASEQRCTPRLPRLQRAQWLRMSGEAAFGTGDITGVITETAKALGELDQLAPRSRLASLWQATTETLALVRHRAPPPSDAVDWIYEAAVCAGQVTQAYYLKSQIGRGLLNAMRCMRLALRSGAPGAATQSYAHVGYVCGSARLSTIAQACFARARALREVADPNVFGGTLYFEAIYETGLGHWQSSQELGREAVEMLERIGNRQEAEIANAIVANSLFYEGRLAESEACCRGLLESARARGNAHHIAWGLFLGGRALLSMGRLPEALAALEEGHSLLQPLDDLLSKVMCAGSLARAYLYAGQPQQALATAQSLEQLLRTRWVMPLAQCLDGVGALPEVAAVLSRVSDAPGLAATVVYANQHLRRFAWMFPIAQPQALRHGAAWLWSRGSHHRARRLWQRSLRKAAQLHMPYDAARAHQALAQHARGTDERERHATQARRLFTQLDCRYHLAELEDGRGKE